MDITEEMLTYVLTLDKKMTREQAAIRILQWDAAFSEAILHGENAQSVLAAGSVLLPWPYALVDRDMVIVYEWDPDTSVRWWHDREPVVNGSLSPEFVQNLLQHRQFHDAADRAEAFYYYDDMYDQWSLCCNIFRHNHYDARLVLLLQPGVRSIPEGARQLFERFGAHIADLWNHSSKLSERKSYNLLKQVCRTLCEGGPIEENVLQAALNQAGWGQSATFQVIRLTFFSADGWDSRPAVTLPYLVTALERLWPDSCAFSTGEDIVWVLHPEAGAQKVFRQELAVFLRDHICRAGVSPLFHDLSELNAYLWAADAALKTGRQADPSFWYFLYEDYRLESFLSPLREQVPQTMLTDPAIRILRDYDQTHESELERTLQTYLQLRMNMTAAARALYVHRTTFCRRMEKILELTGLNLDDSDRVLSLMLSFRVQQ